MPHQLSSFRRVVLVFPLAAALASIAGRASDKPAVWVEVRTPHLTVYSDGGAKTAERIAMRFEQIRDVFLQTLAHIRVDPGQPIIILAARNEKSLAALLPDLYQQKGHVHPTGMFSPGPDRNYIALRADVGDEELPYHTLYHEYTHLVTHLNSRFLPAWLEEGYADFFGNTRIIGRDVSLGWAPASEMDFLRHARLLPLEQLFAVDHRSPYYNEANKANIFYAESWALVHMLFLDPQYRKSKMLGAYVTTVDAGVDPVEAGRRAFGDLSTLQKRLEGYIRMGNYAHAELRSPIEQIQKSFSVRTVSQPETDVLLGDFFLARGRMARARPLLEQALQLTPDSAAANEGLGMVHMRLGETQAAAGYFARAVQLHSQSFLTYYYYATSLLETTLPGTPSDEAERSLLKCTSLNPGFAPAYAALAQLYARQQQTLGKALQAARTAASLAPSAWQGQLTLALVLADQGQFDEARTIASRVAATVTEPNAAAAAAAALARIAQGQQYQADLRRYGAPPAPAPATPAQPILLDRRGGGPPPSATQSGVKGAAVQENVSVTAAPAAPARIPHLYSMIGKIVAVQCTASPEVLLTLSLGGLSMKLHAQDLSKVRFLDAAGAPSTHPPACAQLSGLAALIRYVLTDGKPYDGEISSIGPAPLP